MGRKVYLWTDEKLEQLRCLSKTHTYQQAADEMGLKLHQVKSAAKCYDVKFCNSKEIRNSQIIYMVIAGRDMKDIAAHFGITRQRVSQICIGI